MTAVDDFAREAARFRAWARNEMGGDEAAVREALVRLAALYSAGLRLPAVAGSGETAAGAKSDCDSDCDLDAWEAPFVVDKKELERILQNASKLPVGYYQETLELRPERDASVGMGDLQDDIADIYSDVVRGLAVYEAGHRAAAHEEWVLHFRVHWGVHATGAMRALHDWLVWAGNHG